MERRLAAILAADVVGYSRNSSFTYKGTPTKVQTVAEDLGVRYVVEGSVRRIGDQVRINAQLVDALSGHHLWAERCDGTLADVFGLQDRVVAKMVSALTVNLTKQGAARAADAETYRRRLVEGVPQGAEPQARYPVYKALISRSAEIVAPHDDGADWPGVRWRRGGRGRRRRRRGTSLR